MDHPTPKDWAEAHLQASGENTRGHMRRAVPRWREEKVEFTPEGITTYLARWGKGKKPATVNSERGLISWYLKWRGTPEVIKRVPMARVQPRLPRVATAEEIAAIAKNAEPRLALFAIVAVETGLRRANVLGLTWDRIDLDIGWVTIPAEEMKSQREYSAPLSPTALDIIKAAHFIRGRWASPRVCRMNMADLSRLWRDACSKAKVRGLNPHDLRRTYITNLRRAGVPLEVAMALSDHKCVNSFLKIYRAVERDDLLRAVGREARDAKAQFP